jgi:hypothetical protein
LPLPVLPVTTTWASEEIVPAPVLRAQVSDAVALLAARPMFIGSQTAAAQSIGTGATTAITLDTEQADNWSGHQISTDSSQYYGMLAGWYLCEASVPLNYTGGNGTLSAEIGGVQNGGSLTYYGGQRAGSNSGRVTGVTCAKLMQMVSVGTFGAGDYISAGVFQSSGNSQDLLNAAGQFPYLSARWVSALAGTQPLIVPTNDAWPSPPAVLGHVFVNKNVRDTINFLIYPPIGEWVQSATQNLASQSSVPATGTTIGLGSVALNPAVVDNYGAYNQTSNVWTAPVAGVYYAYGQLGLTTGSNAVSLGAGLTVTSPNYNSGSAFTIWGGTQAAVASSVQCASVRRRLRLSAGDTISLAGFQKDSGSASNALNTTGSWLSRLILVWECA